MTLVVAETSQWSSDRSLAAKRASSRIFFSAVPAIAAIRAKPCPRSLMEATARPASARWRSRRASASACNLTSRC